MTPRRPVTAQEALAPIVRTPASTLKSIVESARKTGLHASPVRVLFAQSPLARPAAVSHVTGDEEIVKPSPLVVAKEPSAPIKAAFITRLVRDADDETVEDAEAVSLSKETESVWGQEQEWDAEPTQEPDAKRARHDTAINALVPPSDNQDDADETDFNPLPSFTLSISHEFPNQDNDGRKDGREPQTKATTVTSLTNPLLPSGIVKLLEKKRLEREQHHQIQSRPSSASASVSVGKKFDLQESLKRPLPYKPHVGSGSRKPSSTEDVAK